MSDQTKPIVSMGELQLTLAKIVEEQIEARSECLRQNPTIGTQSLLVQETDTLCYWLNSILYIPDEY